MQLAVICDEVTALGWRLAGARVAVPQADAVEAAWHECLAQAQLVLITAELAARVPPAQLSAALATSQPLVLVIPDLRRRQEPLDPAAQVDRALGIKL
jgi:vacuolar-type H+-ATPase subunit F/Vma7